MTHTSATFDGTSFRNVETVWLQKINKSQRYPSGITKGYYKQNLI